MKAYKLLRKRKDGSLGSLFIGRDKIVPIGEWIGYEDIPTKGYAHRPGFHACSDTVAPHLTMKGRVWCEVELKRCKKIKRPESQGTTWLLAEKMKVIKKLDVRHDNPFDKGDI